MTAPSVEKQIIKQEISISAPIDFVWSMLTNRDDLCDWLCDDAHVNVRENGFATFIWRDRAQDGIAPHAYGFYQTVIEHEKIVLTWEDGHVQDTTVKIKLDPQDDSVNLSLWHKGFVDDDRVSHYQNFWADHLATLKRMLETGERPDIADRVIIGVMVATGDEEQQGHVVNNVIEGFSAADAGIEVGDIIIAADGTTLDENTQIYDVTRNKKPGDSLDVTYLRGGQEHTVTATLKGHPIPPMPTTFDEMAQQHRDEYDRVNGALKTALSEVTDDIATRKPDDAERSISEILALMIINQRHTYEWLATYANGPRRINPYYRDAERVQAVLDVYPTVNALVSAYQTVQDETVAIINAFDKALEKRKDYLWWMVFEIWRSEDIAMERIATIKNLSTQVQQA